MTRTARNADVKPLDLAGGERLLSQATLGAERVARAFARSMKKSMSFLSAMKGTIVASPAALVPGAEAAERGPGVEVRVDLVAEDGAWATLVVSQEAVGLILEATLGGKGSFWEVQLGPQLTLLQRPVVDRIVHALAGELERCVVAETGVKMSPRTDSMTADRQGGDVVKVVLTIDGFPVPVPFTVFLAPDAFQAKKVALPIVARAEANPRMERAMEDVGVELIAELGRCSLGLKRLLSLRVGDIVRLPTATDDPVKVRIAGVEKFSAAPVISRGQVAVEISGNRGAGPAPAS